MPEGNYVTESDVYDPDDVALRDSPPLKPLQPILQPTPSPSLDESGSEDAQPVPAQGDAVLISLLGNGKALEVARVAATQLLPADNERREVSTTRRECCHVTNLKDLAASALNYTWRTETAPDVVAPRPLYLNSVTIDKLAPIQSPLPKSNNAKGTTLPSISALTEPAHAARRDGKDPDLNRPSLSETQQLPLATPDNKSYRQPLPPGPLPVASGRPSPTKLQFECTYPSCTAQPFTTSYLLKSHQNVHQSHRPYYCPVKGCPRGKGGKGFKRKNEMIRHGLVHESPGYACPYCTDVTHKYPRPDNLQRLVIQLSPMTSRSSVRLLRFLQAY
jgi:hypothetical protein